MADPRRRNPRSLPPLLLSPARRRATLAVLSILLLIYTLVFSLALPPWPAACAPLAYGSALGAVAAVAIAAAAAPAALVAWITVVVLMAVAGKPRRKVVAEGGKITVDVAGAAFRAVLAREGNAVAAALAAASLAAALKWWSTC